MGYRLNRRDEPVFMTGQKPSQTVFGIQHRLDSCKGAEYLEKILPGSLSIPELSKKTVFAACCFFLPGFCNILM